MYNRNFKSPQRDLGPRINWHILVPNVRVVQDDVQLGVMPTDAARKLAQDAGLDLVEVAPGSHPPVCRIMDYGRFKYEQKIKQKENLRKQRESATQVKEIRLRPGIADHDVTTKMNQARKFLQDGNKVQLNLQFRGHREMTHKDVGFLVVERVVAGLQDVGTPEKAPRLEGNRLTCLLSPRN